MTEIKLYKSPLRAIKLLLISSIFVPAVIWSLTSTNSHTPKWVNWMIICFSGLGYAVGFFHLFDRRPQIIINEIGIYDRTTHKEFINWDIIQDAYILNIHRQKFICLVIDEQFKPSKKKGQLYQQTAKLSEAIGAQELNLSLSQIKIDEKKLTDFILAMRTATKQQRDNILTKELTQWTKKMKA